MCSTRTCRRSVSRLELAELALVLLVELGALDRRPRHVDERRQGVELGLPERAPLETVVDVHGAHDAPAHPERKRHDAPSADGIDAQGVGEAVVLDGVRGEDGLPASHDRRARSRRRTQPSGDLNVLLLEVACHPDLGLVALRGDHEEAALGAADLDDVIHDDLEQPVEVELAVQRLRDAVEATQAVVLVALAALGTLAEDLRIGRAAGHALGGVGRRRLLEPDARLAHADDVAGLQRGTIDEVPVQARPVLRCRGRRGRTGAVVPLHLAVVARSPEIHDRNVVVLGAPEVQDLLVQVPHGASQVLVEDEPGQWIDPPG